MFYELFHPSRAAFPDYLLCLKPWTVGRHAMLTLEVHGQLITWPKDFALTMMRYYRSHDVPFRVHRNLHAGVNAPERKAVVQVRFT
jgi:hypothetical protein